jgi:hypothetical protein
VLSFAGPINRGILRAPCATKRFWRFYAETSPSDRHE